MALQIGEKKLYLILAILNLRIGLCKILLITSFASVEMELEFIASSHYGCI